jgi:hydroxyacylglutathione hydrolase
MHKRMTLLHHARTTTMSLQIKAIPAFSDNYIWAITAADKAILVDPGDATPVFEFLQQHQITPVGILITHHHYDHTGGIHDLTTAYSMPVYAPAHESVRGVTHTVKAGDNIDFAEFDACINVMDVPGHTRGHVAYVLENCLFCGDTLFTAGCGRLFEGTAEQMHNSLSQISLLPDDTLVYCAHEYTAANLQFAQVVEPDNPDIQARIQTTAKLRQDGQATVPALLSLEKQTNPFLRGHLPHVAHAAETFAGKTLATPASVFATLRYWKDTLD